MSWNLSDFGTANSYPFRPVARVGQLGDSRLGGCLCMRLSFTIQTSMNSSSSNRSCKGSSWPLSSSASRSSSSSSRTWYVTHPTSTSRTLFLTFNTGARVCLPPDHTPTAGHGPDPRPTPPQCHPPLHDPILPLPVVRAFCSTEHPPLTRSSASRSDGTGSPAPRRPSPTTSGPRLAS
jgi:hypothetical protein